MPHMIKIWNRSVQLSRIFKQYTVNSDKNTIYFYLILIFNFYSFPQISNSNIDHTVFSSSNYFDHIWVVHARFRLEEEGEGELKLLSRVKNLSIHGRTQKENSSRKFVNAKCHLFGEIEPKLVNQVIRKTRGKEKRVIQWNK